jgi:hypothetical protein
MSMGTETGKPEGSKTRDLIVLDLGDQKTKSIDRLRKGRGKLMDEVNECISELQSSGAIGANVQPIVVVVSERTEMTWPLTNILGL